MSAINGPHGQLASDQATDQAQQNERLSNWEDIERAAMNCPVLHRAVTLVRHGEATREQAMIQAALVLSQIRVNLMNEQQYVRERMSGFFTGPT